MRRSEYESRRSKLVEELKNLEAEKVVEDIWQPKENETYFYVTSEFEVDETTNELTSLDRKMVKAGNCFKTKEEAMYYADYLLYNLKYRRFIDENRNHCIHTSFLLPRTVMPDAVDYIGKENYNKYVL